MAYIQIPAFSKSTNLNNDTEFVIVVDGKEYLVSFKTLSEKFGNSPELLQDINAEIEALRNIVDAFPSENPAAPIALKIADTPTIDGIYKPTETGVYPNAGGLEYDPTEGITYFIRTQGVWTKDVTPINFTPTGVVEEGNTQAVSGGEVFSKFSDLATKAALGLKLDATIFNEIAEKHIGKNIFDKSKIVIGEYLGGNPLEIRNLGGNYKRSGYIPVEPGKTYRRNNAGTALAGFESMEDTVSVFTIPDNQRGFTVPSGVYFIVVNFSPSQINPEDTLQIEEGTVSTSYEPYQEWYEIKREALPLIEGMPNIKNILKDGNFEIDSNEDGVADEITEILGGHIGSLTTDSKVGNYAQRITANSLTNSINISSRGELVADHLYYHSVFVKTNIPNGNFKLYTGSSFSEFLNVPVNTWERYDDIKKYSGVIPYTNKYFEKNDIQTGEFVQYDGEILIDLTEAFGEGKEPSKEQIRQIIEYAPDGWFADTLPSKYIIEWMVHGAGGDMSNYALKSQISNVDNTSDADKPISNAAAAALAGKVDKVPGYTLIKQTEAERLALLESVSPPIIGANGNWWVNGVDTGKPSRGQVGNTGDYIGVGQEIDNINLKIENNKSLIEDSLERDLDEASGVDPISFKNYLGNTQNMHFKVLGFNSLWNGYRYWLGYTPYVNSDISTENPCIAVSNDKINWETPAGLINPLDNYPGVGVGTNSDTHLVYREDTSTLELWWRTYNMSEVWMTLYRRTTTDGINWSPKQAMFVAPTAESDAISPAIIFEDGKYKMWYVTQAPHKIAYQESADESGTSWSSREILDIELGSFTPWHIDVIKTNKGVEMVVSERTATDTQTRDIFYILQKPSGEFTVPKRIIKVNEDKFQSGAELFYRPCIYKENDIYYIYYSYRNVYGEWATTLTTGKSVEALKGYKVQSIDKRMVYLSNGDVIKDFDVSGVEFFIIPNGTSVTFESFINAKVGQEIKVIVLSSTSSAIFKPSQLLRLTSLTDNVILTHNQRKATIDFVKFGNQNIGIVSM